MGRYLSYVSVFFLFLLVSCSKESSFEQGKISHGSLQGAFGDCLTKNVIGNYSAGKSLNDSNYIEVEVDVTETGRYTIYTDTVNGYFFKGTGNFSTPGTYTIQMKGAGKPETEGTNDFIVFYDSTFCNLSVTVGSGSSSGGGGGTTSGDYFPLSQNSFWSYDDGAGSDTIKIMVSGAAAKGGKTYQRFVTTYESGPPNDTAFYRKDNATGFYYNAIDTSFFGGAITFTQPVLDVLFLKNSLTNNATWNSDFPGKVQGVSVTVRFKFTCANANASVTANGVTYNNVYKITSVIQAGSGVGFSDISPLPDMYYAKGIGLIQSSDQLFGDQVIRYYEVF
jgi:hypothetical protein